MTRSEHAGGSLVQVGSAPDPTSWAGMARLLRRTGFGATGTDVDAAVALGPQKYVATMLAADPDRDPGALQTPPPDLPPVAALPAGADRAARQARNRQIADQMAALTSWWVGRMVAVRQPFGERLTFLWHHHFATSASKVRRAPLMLAQNATLRRRGRGGFRDLAYAMLTDAAMLVWLDGEENTKGAPNENLSREFMELFALGHGNGYTETDVREGAVALTGWRLAPGGGTRMRPALHDDGVKIVLGVSGDLDAGGFCDAVLAAPAASGYLITRTYGQLVSDHPPTAATLAGLATAYGADRNLTRLLTAMLGGPGFAAAAGTSVVTPVEWLVGAVRALRLAPEAAALHRWVGVLRQLGQLPFYPPNVGGWPTGSAFLTTAAADLRMRTAAALTAAADLGAVAGVAPDRRLDAVAHLLGIATWSDRSAAALRDCAAQPATLVAVALNTPEYLVA